MNDQWKQANFPDDQDESIPKPAANLIGQSFPKQESDGRGGPTIFDKQKGEAYIHKMKEIRDFMREGKFAETVSLI